MVAQSMMLQGFSPAQTGAFLGQTPLVRSLAGQGIVRPGETGISQTFPFMPGRKLPGREYMQASQSQQGLMGGLAAFSGRRPEDFWGEFMRFRPQGGTVAPAQFI